MPGFDTTAAVTIKTLTNGLQTNSTSFDDERDALGYIISSQ